MKRSTLALLVVAALAAGTAQPALAAAKKPAPKPKPITKTYYFHGTNASGNQDQNQNPGANELMTMDATKPAGASDKDFAFYGAGTSPNRSCAGSSLFPNWVGAASGTITGTMTVSFYARSTPSASAVVQVFSDVTGQACADDRPAPLGEATVPLTAGASSVLHTVKIPVMGKGKTLGAITVQIQPGVGAGGLNGPQVSGVAYDSTVSPSAITFTCLPNAGKKSC